MRSAAFRTVLRSTIGFFALAIAAIVIGFTRGRGYVAPTSNAPWPVLVVFLLGMGLPAFTAACLIVAWVRFSDGAYVSARRLARIPWLYALVFGALLVLRRG